MPLSEKEARYLHDLERRQQQAKQPLDPNAPPGTRIYLSLTAYEEAELAHLRQKRSAEQDPQQQERQP